MGRWHAASPSARRRFLEQPASEFHRRRCRCARRRGHPREAPRRTASEGSHPPQRKRRETPPAPFAGYACTYTVLAGSFTMSEATDRYQSVMLLAIAGFASALFTMVTQGFAGSQGFVLYPGFVFGASVAACFVVHEGVRSVGKIVAFVAASTAAHVASLFAAIGLTLLLHAGASMESDRLDIPPLVLFVSGCVGASIILGAAFFLFSPSNAVSRSLRSTLLGTVIGGLLGVLGWAGGPLIGRPMGAPWQHTMAVETRARLGGHPVCGGRAGRSNVSVRVSRGLIACAASAPLRSRLRIAGSTLVHFYVARRIMPSGSPIERPLPCQPRLHHPSWN
jgi:hypothetical protein